MKVKVVLAGEGVVEVGPVAEGVDGEEEPKRLKM